MNVEKDSYIIVQQGNKKHLCMAINPERNRAVIDSTLIGDEVQYVTYDDKTLLACLGKKPANGQAFGVTIAPYLRTTDTEIGSLDIFRRMKKLEKRALLRAITKTHGVMIENQLDVFPFSQIQIRPKKGKYAGMYKFSRKGTETRDALLLYPETFEDTKWNEYMLFHEYGHAVWYKMMNKSLKSKWIKLYETRIELSKVDKKTLESLRTEYINSDGYVNQFKKDLEEEDKQIFGEVLKYFSKYHSLSATSLEILCAEDSVKLAEMWPTTAQIKSNVREDPSAYAMTSPEEFFAECFAFHMGGKKMSLDITKAIKGTLKRVKALD